jgi:hypothetical protein
MGWLVDRNFAQPQTEVQHLKQVSSKYDNDTTKLFGTLYLFTQFQN